MSVCECVHVCVYLRAHVHVSMCVCDVWTCFCGWYMYVWVDVYTCVHMCEGQKI